MGWKVLSYPIWEVFGDGESGEERAPRGLVGGQRRGSPQAFRTRSRKRDLPGDVLKPAHVAFLEARGPPPALPTASGQAAPPPGQDRCADGSQIGHQRQRRDDAVEGVERVRCKSSRTAAKIGDWGSIYAKQETCPTPIWQVGGL